MMGTVVTLGLYYMVGTVVTLRTVLDGGDCCHPKDCTRWWGLLSP